MQRARGWRRAAPPLTVTSKSLRKTARLLMRSSAQAGAAAPGRQGADRQEGAGGENGAQHVPYGSPTIIAVGPSGGGSASGLRAVGRGGAGGLAAYRAATPGGTRRRPPPGRGRRGAAARRGPPAVRPRRACWIAATSWWFSTWPALRPITWPDQRRARAGAGRPTRSRILWRTNSSGKRRLSLSTDALADHDGVVERAARAPGRSAAWPARPGGSRTSAPAPARSRRRPR